MKSSDHINLNYSEQYPSRIHLYALVGDFGAGKTTTLEMFKSKTDYYTEDEFFDFIPDNKIKVLKEKYNGTPLVIQLNKLRDKQIKERNPSVAIVDQDALTLAGYEFAKLVHGMPSEYKELVKKLWVHRRIHKTMEPSAYIILNVRQDIRKQRLVERAKKGRLTDDFISSEITHVAFKSFYQCVFNMIDKKRFITIDTSNTNADIVFQKCKEFVEHFEQNYEPPINIWEIVSLIQVDSLLSKTKANLTKENLKWNL